HDAETERVAIDRKVGSRRLPPADSRTSIAIECEVRQRPPRLRMLRLDSIVIATLGHGPKSRPPPRSAPSDSNGSIEIDVTERRAADASTEGLIPAFVDLIHRVDAALDALHVRHLREAQAEDHAEVLRLRLVAVRLDLRGDVDQLHRRGRALEHGADGVVQLA